MSDGIIGVRIDSETRAALDHYCEIHGISISELVRGAIDQILRGQMSYGGVDQGYKAAKQAAVALAELLLIKAKASLPETFDEAMARGLIG